MGSDRRGPAPLASLPARVPDRRHLPVRADSPGRLRAMSVRDRVWPILISVLAAVSLVVVLLDLTFAARAPVVLAFAVIGPGMALVRLIRLDEPWVELVLA